jgi:hypothetical protein
LTGDGLFTAYPGEKVRNEHSILSYTH